MDKIKKIFSENGALIVICVIILLTIIPGMMSGQSKDGEETSRIENKTKYDLRADSMYGEISIKGTDEGFDFYIKPGEKLGSINGEEEIEDFINTIKEGKGYRINQNDMVGNNIIESGNSIGIVIDNTYSYRNNIIDKTLPQKKLDSTLEYLDKNKDIKIGTKGQIGRLFSYKYGTPESHMNEDVYNFIIDPSQTNIVIYATGEVNRISYIKSRNKLVLKNIGLSHYSSIDDIQKNCTYKSTYDFVCRNKKDLLHEIQNIYQKQYKDNDDKHKGTNLLDYLFTKGFYSLNNIYIFSDGEFQISKETSKTYLSDINGSFKLKDTLDFNANTYSNKIDFYEKYRLGVSEILQKNITKCNNNNITFVGLTSNSAPFIDFTKRIYNVLFQGCTINFNS